MQDDFLSIITRSDIKTEYSPLVGNTPIHFGKNSIEILPDLIREIEPDRVFIISDTTVYPIHSEILKNYIPEEISFYEVIIDPGESTKNLANLELICETLFSKGATKSSLILNFGGGVILNLGGLAASLIYRGISFIQIPTTLLAQSDVIVSNKQSINFAGSKNRLGVFSTAKAALVDPQWLSTEPVRQTRAAMVEYCKNALILGNNNYQKALDVCKSDPSGGDFEKIILDSLHQKFEIARKDPSEKKFGLILEYGHTAGHAIEYLSNGKLYHGEAIWHGLNIAGNIGVEIGVFDRAENKKQKELLSLIPCIPPVPEYIDTKNLCHEMLKDNKKTGDGVQFVLLSRLGRVSRTGSSILTPVEYTVLEKVLHHYLNAVL